MSKRVNYLRRVSYYNPTYKLETKIPKKYSREEKEKDPFLGFSECLTHKPRPPVRRVIARRIFMMEDVCGRYALALYRGREYWIFRREIELYFAGARELWLSEQEAFRSGIIPFAFPAHWDLPPKIYADSYFRYKLVKRPIFWIEVRSIRLESKRKCWRVGLPDRKWAFLNLNAVVDQLPEWGVIAVQRWVTRRYSLDVVAPGVLESYELKPEYRKSRRLNVPAHRE